ncbi:MAG TPA: protein kinase [Rhabdochlamydiaceae bacterium]|nr:protein kinase [Rhabdochlamydiaceae bacterium]
MDEKSFYKQTTIPDYSSGEAHAPMPKQIGPYKIESLLNKGGMSFLYLGLHPETKQALAVKVLSPKYVTHPDAVERFLKEAHIIELTNHPNIVKLYGQGEWEGGLYIAMELIQGVSLRQFILQQSLSLKRSIDIILQVAYALLHLHTHGVIHRDLKPENILITEDGEIKVIDFGIAQLHEDTEAKKREASRQFMGTPNYMSPEQKEDPSKVSYSSDIYSLGVIAYELFLGKLSYGILNLALLPKGLRTIVEKALAVSVKERYQDIVDFIGDVSQYLKSGELEKEKPGTDQFIEIMETMQKAQQNLSPPSAPDWPVSEIGIAKYRGAGQMGWYYDFFKLPNNSYVVVLAQASDTGINGNIYIGVLRGMIRTLMLERTPAPNQSFNATQLISTLNRMISEDILGVQFSLCMVVLAPLTDQMTYLSCGMGKMFHVPQGSPDVRSFPPQNPSLGMDAATTFSATSDNWYVGDTLILHTLDQFAPTEESSSSLEPQFLEAISENITFSAQRQAEAILKKMSMLPAFTLHSSPKAILVLQRIA